ncbi:hypothetical protein BRADI_1g35755v3 [Brachypodium distachyon]|uniref:Uncharacterized protein n=1 Tax=Brachypodium distachyon TaxID=15368 RepID=A0A2K2DMW9_BRADI|nr:hypothetical protein BRADI_1g35755v3 [Brachypodium distachyon]
MRMETRAWIERPINADPTAAHTADGQPGKLCQFMCDPIARLMSPATSEINKQGAGVMKLPKPEPHSRPIRGIVLKTRDQTSAAAFQVQPLILMENHTLYSFDSTP